jgi:hypothetical protein
MKKHHIIKLTLGFIIIAASVGGVFYLQGPDVELQRDRTDHSISAADRVTEATSSVLEFLPTPAIGPPPSEAAPTITWTPASLNDVVGQGQSKTLQVSFTTSENIRDVAVRVVPELQPLVSVSPSAFASIPKGQTVSINITVTASSTPFGTNLGAIQLRSATVNGGVIARPLPVSINIWRRFISGDSTYEILYERDLGVTDVTSTRPGFLSGVIFSKADASSNLVVAVYDNSSHLALPDWYTATLADKEYTFPDAINRSIQNTLLVDGLPALQVQSNVLGFIKLRTFVADGATVIGLETTVPDHMSVPDDYFLMVKSFRLLH